MSNQKTANANLHIDQVEVDAAVEQASQFSRVCRVWAPIYRQQTVAGLLDVTGYKQTTDVAFKSLLAGWRDYLAHDNHGRPFVLIGHSQGAAMLIRLIRSQIDANPAAAEAARVGDRPRRERPGAGRQDRRRQLPARPGLYGRRRRPAA